MDSSIYSFLGKDLYKLTPTPSQTSVVSPSNIDSGTSTGFTELGYGGLKQGKNAFDNTETGFILGIDNGLAKFYIGNTTNYLNWNGTALTIAGNFVLGGTLITVSSISDLQTAITTVSGLGGGTVALVPTTYTATSSFTLPSNVTLDMSGATIDFGNGAYQILIEGTNAYSTGTLSVNYNSTSVTGSGTTWTATMVGQSILIGDYWFEITARTSDTAITISPAFHAPNVTGATYVIATTVDSVAVVNGTLQNASGTLLKFRYLNGMTIDGMFITDAAQGIDGDDSATVQWINSTIQDCTTGVTFDNVRFGTFDNWSIIDITGGTAVALNGVSNTAIGVASIQDVVGVGMKFTNCFNLGFINYAIIECSSHGIEFVSGNRDVDLESGYTDTVGGDAIKLTATSDNINIDAQSFYNYTGYGINIAASSCDKTKIGLIAYGGGGSGTINDSGTGTVIMGDDTAYNATTWNGNLGTPTKNTIRDKIETITGGETAALVSDTAYASSWNGVTTIAPSKNAVYDKIETLSALTFKNGTTTKNAADNDSGTAQNIAHGLGVTPKYVRITAIEDTVDVTRNNIATTVYNGTTQSSVSRKGNGTVSLTVTTFDLDNAGIPASNYNRGVVTFDSTNIIITWTETGNAAGVYTLLWEAYG